MVEESGIRLGTGDRVDSQDSTYYSPAMAALTPPAERRRPRPGSLARPVNGRLYRGTWLLVALPLLVTAFTVARPGPLPAPQLPPVFDGATALQVAQDLAVQHPDRSPGSQGAANATAWLREQLEPYGLRIREDRFQASIPGLGRRELVNLIAVAPGRSNQAIVVMAHRDNTGTGPGANDNASGTAALVELARSYATTASTTPGAPALGTTNTLVFLSTDGGAYGGLGAARFAATSQYRERTVAVVNLVALGGTTPPRIEIAGDRPRSPAAALVRTAAARVLEQTGRELGRPRAIEQLIDLGFPFTLYEQGPFVGRGISAITLTTAGPRPPSSFTDTPQRLSRQRLTEVGRSAQALVSSLDQGLELAQGTQSYVFLGSRFVRGWAIQLSLVAALLPFMFAAIDLFARCRRRHIRIAPALRSFRSRLGFWLWLALLFVAFSLLGGWGDGAARPLSPESAAATKWPIGVLVIFGLLALAGWLVARDRLVPRRAVTPEEELAGHTTALLALAVVALLVVAVNPFALLFVLPALHTWLWLPQVRSHPRWVRAGVFVAGFAGPLLLLASFARRFDLGLDAPWYLAKLAAVGYVEPPALLIVGAWLAVSAQLAALTAGRYAPYPAPAERPPRGPLRELVRGLLLLTRRRRESTARRSAVG
jgi:Peptidase family M28